MIIEYMGKEGTTWKAEPEKVKSKTSYLFLGLHT